MRIAFLGTRGVPARYGGFETAAEEIGKRLVARGHEVIVYCRRGNTRSGSYLGMRLVHLPAVRWKFAETLSHTALSTAHLIVRRKQPDATIVFNSANAPLLPLLRRRSAIAVHVDGLEWRRTKWSGLGRFYYRVAEALSVRWADELIADADGIQQYYIDEFGVESRRIAYGAPQLHDLPAHRLSELDLSPGGFHVLVARFEPENHVELIVRGYRASVASLPLVVVGSAPYADAYTDAVRAAAGSDPRIRLIGPVWDQQLLDQLYAHAATYLHGHSVGGTNPSLLRAMGAGSAVIAFDVTFNREVLQDTGRYFRDANDVSREVERSEGDLAAERARGIASQRRAAAAYDWDAVTAEYEAMCRDLQANRDRRPRRRASGRRTPASAGGVT